MGACYSVILKMKKPFDEEEIKKAISLAHFTVNAVWEPTNGKLLENYMATLLTKSVKKEEREDEILFYSDFDASYGWEIVLLETFSILAKTLPDGSEMEIQMEDWGATSYVVKNHLVCQKH